MTIIFVLLTNVFNTHPYNLQIFEIIERHHFRLWNGRANTRIYYDILLNKIFLHMIIFVIQKSE